MYGSFWTLKAAAFYHGRCTICCWCQWGLLMESSLWLLGISISLWSISSVRFPDLLPRGWASSSEEASVVFPAPLPAPLRAFSLGAEAAPHRMPVQTPEGLSRPRFYFAIVSTFPLNSVCISSVWKINNLFYFGGEPLLSAASTRVRMSMLFA